MPAILFITHISCLFTLTLSSIICAMGTENCTLLTTVVPEQSYGGQHTEKQPLSSRNKASHTDTECREYNIIVTFCRAFFTFVTFLHKTENTGTEQLLLKRNQWIIF